MHSYEAAIIQLVQAARERISQGGLLEEVCCWSKAKLAYQQLIIQSPYLDMDRLWITLESLSGCMARAVGLRENSTTTG